MSAQGNYCLVFVTGSLQKGFGLAIAKLRAMFVSSVADLHKSIMQGKFALVRMRTHCRFQY